MAERSDKPLKNHEPGQKQKRKGLGNASQKRKKVWVIILAVVLVAIAAGVYGFFAAADISVDVYRLSRRDFAISFTEDGWVIPDKERNVHAVFTAHIAELMVEEGGRVNKGDLLAVLCTREIGYTHAELQSNLASISAEKDQAMVELEAAERAYRRLKILYDQHWASEVEMEEAEKLLQTSRSRVESLAARQGALNAQLQTVEYHMENCRIYAPFGGVVARMKAEEGMPITPHTPLLTLYHQEKSDELKIETMVLTRDVGDIEEGMNVTLTYFRRDEDVEFTGKVIEIAPYAIESVSPLGLEEERVTVTISSKVPENLPITSGYRVEVKFITAELPAVVVVPRTSLFTYEGEDALFVVEDNRLELREITTGPRTRHEIVITDGLEEGDLVVLDYRQDGIEKGARVSWRTINSS